MTTRGTYGHGLASGPLLVETLPGNFSFEEIRSVFRIKTFDSKVFQKCYGTIKYSNN